MYTQATQPNKYILYRRKQNNKAEIIMIHVTKRLRTFKCASQTSIRIYLSQNQSCDQSLFKNLADMNIYSFVFSILTKRFYYS